jgi:hypothetical protein
VEKIRSKMGQYLTRLILFMHMRGRRETYTEFYLGEKKLTWDTYPKMGGEYYK